MAQSLTANQIAQARVMFAMLILALTMQKVGEERTAEGSNLPAVQQCSAFIDDTLASLDEDVRAVMIEKIQRTRTKFSKKVEKVDAGSAMLGAIRLLISPLFKSHPGTRFDFIRQTLRKNTANLDSELFEAVEPEIQKFFNLFRSAVLSI